MVAKPGQAVKARLACLHHPDLFQTLPAEPLRIFVDDAVLVVHHPPFDAANTAQYDVSAVQKVLECVVSARVVWAPVGPNVRKQLHRMATPPPMTSDDWVNTLDPGLYGGARPGLLAGRPVVGRHSRPDPLKWPDDTATLFAAYPVADDISVRLMGFEPGSVEGFSRMPANWAVQSFGAQPVEQFLQGIDFFSYF